MLTRNLPIEVVRRCYAEQIRFAAGVQSHLLAEAFATVPREQYLGPGPWLVQRATGFAETNGCDPRSVYHDALIAIDRDRHLNNGHPSSLAAWIDRLELKRGSRVFHIGCGLGYYTAIMAYVVGPEGFVLAAEIDADLARRAGDNLADHSNVRVVGADGMTLDPGMVDAILVNAGVTHPQRLWLDRLDTGGRLLVPMTVAAPGLPDSGTGYMLLVQLEDGSYDASFVSPVAIYSSESGRRSDFNTILARKFRETASGKCADVRMVRLDAHRATDRCWLHGEDFCLST